MKKIVFLFCFLCGYLHTQAQNLFFPPTTNTSYWDTLSPVTLGWCQPRIDSLYDFLDRNNTKGFLILKDGKIVLERYFGSFQQDSIHLWASMGKSLTAALVGIAQQETALHLTDTVSNVLGNGWTSATSNQERAILVRHLLTMTSGLDDAPALPCDNLSDTAACLQYLAPAGSRWAYHTGAYYKLHDVVAAASGMTYQNFSNTRLENRIGMRGTWVNGIYYSRPRDVARFGLFILNRGVWATDTILRDTAYFRQMVNTSQPHNLSYGYLWWLNGKSSFMAPGLQTVFPISLMSNAPSDMFCALGKYDQKLYIVPSQNLIVVRMGNSAGQDANAASPFDNDLWQKINELSACAVGSQDVVSAPTVVFPNPAMDILNVSSAQTVQKIRIYNAQGQLVLEKTPNQNQFNLDISALPAAVYWLQMEQNGKISQQKFQVSR